jgi:hypothetical protein
VPLKLLELSLARILPLFVKNRCSILQFKEIILCKGKKINEASAPIATKSKHEWAVNGLSEEGGDSELEALKNETRFGSSGRRTGVGANIGSGGTDS